MAIYYVAKTGLDSNIGSLASPFLTITKGCSVLVAGDILNIRSGTYVESLVDRVHGGSSWATATTVQGYASDPALSVIIKPIGFGWAFDFNNATSSWIILNNMTLDGADAGDNMTGVRVQNSAHHVRIQGCLVQHWTACCIGFFPVLSSVSLYPTYDMGCEVLNCEIYDAGRLHNHSNLDHGIYIAGNNCRVVGCNVHYNATYGIQLYNGRSTTGVNNTVVTGNRSYDNGSERLAPNAHPSNGAGIIITCGDNTIAYNNLCYNNPTGLRLDYGATNSKVYNNTIYGNTLSVGEGGLIIGSATRGTIAKNNIMYSNNTNYSDLGTGTVSSNNLTGVNPLFASAGTGNFHLLAGSPAIDAGVVIN
jgi:hypothetical protein